MRPGGAYPKRIRKNPCSSQHKRKYEDIVDNRWKTTNNRLERLYPQIGQSNWHKAPASLIAEEVKRREIKGSMRRLSHWVDVS